MIVATFTSLFGLWSLVAVVALFAPRAAPTGLRTLLGLQAMVLSWVALYWLALDAVLIALGVSLCALDHAPGRVGIALMTLSFAALCLWLVRLSRARPLLDGRAVADGEDPSHFGLRDYQPSEGAWWPMLTFHTPAMEGVTVTNSVVFREVDRVKLKLDVYSSSESSVSPDSLAVSGAGLRPSVLYIHGGGWAAGLRRQSRFMHHELAADGSVVFAVSYRFAPKFTLPAAVQDVKAAVAWVRAHAHEYGADPERLVVIGSSAGAHLAAMVALSPGVAELQPGFEAADTSVQGAVLLYGVYDLEAQRDATLAFWLRWVVLGAHPETDPARWRLSSPLRWVSAEAPPVLVVHGTNDGLVSPRESEVLVSALKAKGGRRVHHMVVPMGLHGLEAFPSPMQRRVLRVIAAFVRSVQGR